MDINISQLKVALETVGSSGMAIWKPMNTGLGEEIDFGRNHRSLDE